MTVSFSLKDKSSKSTSPAHTDKGCAGKKRTTKPNGGASHHAHTAHTGLSLDQVSLRCRLAPQQLKRRSDAKQLPNSTDEAELYDHEFGQQRAVKAIQTAIDIRANGYHIFAAGEKGLGKRTIITHLLGRIASQQPTPSDWVYVHNFANPRTPHIIQLPTSQGLVLKQTITELWQTAKKCLSSYRYYGANDYVASDYGASDYVANIQANRASTSQSDHHKPTINDDLAPYPQDNNRKDALDAPYLDKGCFDEGDHNKAPLDKNLARHLLTPIFTDAKRQLLDDEAVTSYLDDVMEDMITHADLIAAEVQDFRCTPLTCVPDRYAVNVLVSHTPDSGAPIVYENLPSGIRLLGRINHTLWQGSTTTNVNMIDAGALHRANGGYLLLDAAHLLREPEAWYALKHALQSKQVKPSDIHTASQPIGSLSPIPAAMPLDVKVIIMGEPEIYEDLVELDADFDEIFGIRADFHDDIPRTIAAERALVAKMADIATHHQLLPFDNHAQAAILDHLSLLAEDQNKLSLHSKRLVQLLLESDRHANNRYRGNGSTVAKAMPKNSSPDSDHIIKNDIGMIAHSQTDNEQVTAADVQHAISDMGDRTSYLQELYWQELKNGQQLIDTQNTAVGQINALTVIEYADSDFGMPARLTALIQPNIGSGEILDIERDVELGGSLHAKGMLIMTSYLRAQFSQDHALNFSASLAFEQSYAHIDGDSATLSEACALLSALANVPIKQSLAITGSMNQFGEVQAVGGINAKITGFYDVCQEQGLTGAQGVIIPASNVKQLMLREDIIQAVADNQFQIYAVTTLQEALMLLTDMPVDTRNKKGKYRKRTLYAKIAKRLRKWEDSDLPERMDSDNKPS